MVEISLQDFSLEDNNYRIKHPVVTFFHLIFKSLAIISKCDLPYLLQSNLRLLFSCIVLNRHDRNDSNYFKICCGHQHGYILCGLVRVGTKKTQPKKTKNLNMIKTHLKCFFFCFFAIFHYKSPCWYLIWPWIFQCSSYIWISVKNLFLSLFI